MSRDITLRYVTNAAGAGRAYRFKTLEGAQGRARKLVGRHPKRDPDGYAVQRVTGNCLFLIGCTFEEVFPK